MGCGSSTAVNEEKPPTQLHLVPAEPAPTGIISSASGPEPVAGGGSMPTTVQQWLTGLSMQQYTESFKAAGLMTLVNVTQMGEADLERAGVVKMGHKKKLMKHKELLTARIQQNVSNPTSAVSPAVSKDSPVPILALEATADDSGRLAPQTVLRTDDAVSALLANLPLANGARVRVFKSVHAANNPCEDRHTVVHGKDFIFAGVWDGHTGPHCSQFAEDQIFLNLRRQVERRTPEELLKQEGLREPFERAYYDTDRAFLQEAKRKVQQKEAKGSYLFAGTCAVGAFCDLATQKISVSNLGDSRAVIGLYEPTGLRTVVMSHDQTASDSAEIRRLKTDFPSDPTILINKGTSKAEETDWRVKGICQFTRSIGDFQMKERSIATVYNNCTRGAKVVPAPKTQRRADGTRAPPYVIPTPEFREQHVEDGFLLLASDGLWDELQNEEAVSVVANFLREAKNLDDADIAGKLIEYALQKAAFRVAADIPEVAQKIFANVNNPTAAELRALPQGKKSHAHRSCLHDDISVVITVFGSDEVMRERRASTNPLDNETPTGTLTRKPRQGRRASIQGRKADNGLLTIVGTEENGERELINRRILDVFDTCASMNASQLRFIFDALDVDPQNGLLSRTEAEKLCEHILGEAGTPAVVEALYKAMDHDQTGAITFDNFLHFFSVSQGDDRASGHAALAGFQKLYNLLAEIPLMAHLTQDEQQNLAHALTKKSYADGEVIINQGDEITSASCMYIIDDGSAVCQIDGTTVSRYEKGRYFGELALQQNQPRAATVVADGYTTCSILKAWEFDWLITQQKSLKSLLLERSGRTERSSYEELPDAGDEVLSLLEG